MRGILAAVLVSLAVPMPLHAAPEWVKRARLPVPEIEKLDNGLEVAWFLDKRLPLLDVAMLVRSGHRHDPAGKSGTAQLLSSVMDRGNAGMSAQEFAREVERLGASRYVSSSADAFTLGMHGLAEDADRILELFHSMVLDADLPEAEIGRERGRMLDAWKHLGDYAQSLAGLVYDRVISAGTPYGRGGLRSPDDLKKVSRKDLLAFHKKHFRPGNAILVVVGRVDKEAFSKRLRELFGKWKPHTEKASEKAKKRVFTVAEVMPSKKHKAVLVHRPGLSQAQVRIGFPAPPFTSKARYPLGVGNALFGGMFHSRLNTVIRDKLGLTYGISSSFSYKLDHSYFTISSSTRNETAGKLINKTLEILREFAAKGITGEEAATARDYLVGGFPIEMNTLSSAADRWLAGRTYGMGPEYLNEYIPRVSEVTHQDVNAALKEHLKGGKPMIVIAGDADKLGPVLRKAGIWPVKRVEVDDLM